MAENCANLSDCIGDVWACLTVGVCARTNQPFVTTSLPARSDSRCTYLAIGICNKCGREHDGRMPPLDWANPLARPSGVDACATCGGARDGVPGNENLVDGKPMCDYCHSDLIRTHGVTPAQPTQENKHD